MIFFIPGEIIALFTFPGVIMHEVSHQFVCDIFKIPVYEINYFNIFSKKAGHVIHQKTDSSTIGFFISVAPLIFNSLLCMLFTLPSAASSHIIGDDSINSGISLFLNTVLWWIGISMGINACPSDQDMNNIKYTENESVIMSIIMPILRCFIFVLNLVSRFGINIFYAYGLSRILPHLLFG